jgi:hypothetical protein
MSQGTRLSYPLPVFSKHYLDLSSNNKRDGQAYHVVSQPCQLTKTEQHLHIVRPVTSPRGDSISRHINILPSDNQPA